MTLLSDSKQHMTPLQWSVLQQFFSSPLSAQFFLTGGTALAGFYFAHRTSVDLDFFTLQGFDHHALKKHLESIAQSVSGSYAVRTDAESLVIGVIQTPNDSLKIDLVQDIPVHMGTLLAVDAIRIDALENIGSNKITALYGRLDPKDFVDLFWILAHEPSMKFADLLRDAKKKDSGITNFHLGQIFVSQPAQLSFPKTTPPVSASEIVEFFRQLGETLLKSATRPQFG